MSTVAHNGTRVNDANSNAGWSNKGGGGPSPAAEPQLAYQKSNAVNRKVTSTTSRTGVQYDHGSTIDMTASPLWNCKIKVADAGDLNTTYGVEALIGSTSSAAYSYNISGSGANNDQFIDGYSSQGGLAEGYIIVSINPSISQWREATVGSPSITAIDYFGVAAQFINGGAKSENVAMDAIDVGIGLNYTGSAFSFSDAIDFDQAIDTNRFGWACANGSVITLRGIHEIGAGGVATSGTDESTINFPDGYHGTGDFGIKYDASNAGTTASLNGSYTGLGKIYGADDTRPDLTFSGNSGSSTHSGTFINFRRVELTSSITIDGGDIEANILTGAGIIQNSIIRPNTLSGVAMFVDPDFSVLSNIAFIQSGSGHAIEVTAIGSYNLDGHSFDGFGADGATDAAVYNNSGGEVTLNILNGGESPTVINGSGASTIINNARTLTITGLVNPTKVYLVDTSLVETDPNFLLDSENVTTGTYIYTFNAGSNISALYRLVNLDNTVKEQDVLLDSDNITVPAGLQKDRVYENT